MHVHIHIPLHIHIYTHIYIYTIHTFKKIVSFFTLVFDGDALDLYNFGIRSIIFQREDAPGTRADQY